MARSLISCIFPVFNGDRYLGEALDSIMALSYRPLEIIVADDGSTDRTAFLAADDLGHRNKLMRQMECFETRPELDLCVAHVQNFWIPELSEEAERFGDHRICKPLPGYVPQALLARRTLFETVGHFTTALRYAHATDLFLRAAEHGAIRGNTPGCLGVSPHTPDQSESQNGFCESKRVLASREERIGSSTAGGSQLL
jgi:glycosyltransferase involved in cell wall biosynthesis